ncbi:hypothetical protein ACTI_55430 [Actinoplanes sp. OR16]|uniref:hypothetical protein n=1 Tax=Actinoplanes sp. OR16 TaxID=946334 RepID=UPI000F6DBAD1|nr:hypothetical protein [Actinoplanes sp. OR16]BBH68858.1 hypothetical protein ACTI_55430 [Actinoplanes sp. OR16]
MTTTEQGTTYGVTDAYEGDTRSRARQAVSTAGSKAGSAVKRNPKSSAGALLALAGAAAAAVFLGRRRAAAKATPRNKLAALLHR